MFNDILYNDVFDSIVLRGRHVENNHYHYYILYTYNMCVETHILNVILLSGTYLCYVRKIERNDRHYNYYKLYRFKSFTAIAVIFFSTGIFDDYVNLM